MSLATQISALATRVATEFKAMRSNGETLPPTGTTGHVLQKATTGGSWVPGVVTTSASTVKLTVGTTAPSSPNVGDVWIDTN